MNQAIRNSFLDTLAQIQALDNMASNDEPLRHEVRMLKSAAEDTLEHAISEAQRLTEVANRISKSTAILAVAATDSRRDSSSMATTVVRNRELQALADAIGRGDQSQASYALKSYLNNSSEPARAILAEEFMEGVLAPALREQSSARIIVDAMRHADFKQWARPVLIASQAIMEGAETDIKRIFPELASTTEKICRRLKSPLS